LDGRIALVAGGTGRIGRGVVAALLGSGASVVAVGRDPEQLAEIGDGTDAGDRLLLADGDLTDPGEADRIRTAAVERFGGLDSVVAAVGGWWQGPPVWEIDPETWDSITNRNVRSHFVIARSMIPTLLDRPGASYTFINGTAAESPTPGAALASITSAATLMLMRSLAAEAADHPVRVNALVLNPIATSAKMVEQHPDWLTPADVGAMAAWLASDEAAMVDGSAIHLNGRSPQAG
jgi:3-oxoacyl-[acyl-carrier protein] reductase